MIQLAVLQQPAKFDRDTAIIWINRPPLLRFVNVNLNQILVLIFLL